ncbi:MAG TPA: hypothetical protein VK148_20060 [Xanthobacteraceae bacterium]|nr:hypothetical protein [Xanthobacteraceae bacterium]
MDTSTVPLVPVQPDFRPNAASDAAAKAPATNPLPSFVQVMPRSMLRWEEQGDFDALLARISATLRPADMMEEMWTREVADLVWQIFRLRRMKDTLLDEASYRGLAEVLRPRMSSVPRLEGVEPDKDWASRCLSTLVQRWAANPHAVAGTVQAALAKAGLRLDAVEAKTFELLIDQMERFDRMTMMIERRRNAIVREIGRYRTEFSQQAQRAIESEVAAAPGGAERGSAA